MDDLIVTNVNTNVSGILTTHIINVITVMRNIKVNRRAEWNI